MRVATRRLRAFLRAGGKSLDKAWANWLRDELRWLGRSLGPARDLDVLVGYFIAEIDALGEDAADAANFLAGLQSERAVARRGVVEALASDRYLALLDRLDGVSTPALTGDESPLADRWRREWKRAKSTLSALDADSSDEELHGARIQLKKARYAAELAEHGLGKRGVRFGCRARPYPRSKSAFNSLANTVLSNNARTLEDLVKEMLRPMLKSWLDDNLPGLVERIVKAEIERVSRGR